MSLFRGRREREAETGGSGVSMLSRIGIAVQALGFAAVAAGPKTFQISHPDTRGIQLAIGAAGATLAAYVLFRRSRASLAQNWSIAARTRSDHQLVTSGPYALIRHPIYVALFLWMLAMAMAVGHPGALKLAIPLYIVGTLIRTHVEEGLLRAMFGADYDAYAARVRRFIPHVI
ncbi:MAG: isoprenylcysteine carboxylmethyltransferase family protein [Sphingomonadales bacterium]|nr:isoprenylcysteine carboxylmethyltransferase family protein [Sphingomonadales bacterium]